MRFAEGSVLGNWLPLRDTRGREGCDSPAEQTAGLHAKPAQAERPSVTVTEGVTIVQVQDTLSGALRWWEEAHTAVVTFFFFALSALLYL